MSSNSIDLLEVKGLSDFVLTLNTLFMPSSSTLFSLVLKLFDEVFLSPSDFAGKITKGAVFSEAGKLDGSQGIRNDFSLLGIIRSWDSFEDF